MPYTKSQFVSMSENSSGTVGVKDWIVASPGPVLGYVGDTIMSESISGGVVVIDFVLPSEEFDRFKDLSRGLLQVSKEEMDEKRREVDAQIAESVRYHAEENALIAQIAPERYIDAQDDET